VKGSLFLSRLALAYTSMPLVVVTGASSGIAYQLAKCGAANEFDLRGCRRDEIKKAAIDFEVMVPRLMPFR
jgi:short-subunit dehydrogenase